MKAPLSLGWVSSSFVVIADALGEAVAKAIGPTPEVALDNAMIIIQAVNTQAGVNG